MDNEQNKIKAALSEKCVPCFRKDSCMLLSGLPGQVFGCLGPFKDDEDWERKIREEHEREREAERKEREKNLKSFKKKRTAEDRVEEYLAKKLLCELSKVDEDENKR
jgi:hypothetical protein